MRELLERWSRLEPERCMSGRPTTHICVVVRVGDIDIFHDGAHTVMLDRPSAKQRALLLAAVIEAIEARGWGWDISSSVWRPASPDGPEARRTYSAFVNLRPGVNLDTLREEYNQPSPAAALLCVYLAALEAEGDQ